jgi:hypothetical protein
VHRKSDLVCENIHRSAAVQSLGINIPVEGDSPLHQVMSSGVIFFQKSDHPLLKQVIYSQIGEPAVSQIVVVPFKCLGRVLAVTYGDFGSRPLAEVETELIAILARHAGLVYENALYRKKFEKMLQTQH